MKGSTEMSIPESCVSDDPSFEQDLSMLLDGELNALRAHDVRRHLDVCAHCSELSGAFEGVDRSLRGAALPEVSQALRRNIWNAIEREGAMRDSQSTGRPEPELQQLHVHADAGSRTHTRSPHRIESQQLRISRAGLWRWAGPVFALAASLAIYFAADDLIPFGLGFEQVSEEEIAVAREIDTIIDLDVIANLELVERLASIGAGAG